MRTLALAVLALSALPLAYAVSYQLPNTYEVTGHSCGNQAPAYALTGTNPDGTQNALVFEWTRCSAGGRGAGNTYDSGCASVIWSADGQLLSYAVEWRQQGRTLPPMSQCLGDTTP